MTELNSEHIPMGFFFIVLSQSLSRTYFHNLLL